MATFTEELMQDTNLVEAINRVKAVMESHAEDDELTETLNMITRALAGKQNNLTFDSAPTSGSSNPVTSDGVKTALDGKQNNLTFDSTPTAGSSNPVTSGGVKNALNAVQEALIFDTEPTAGSTNPVTSNGIKAAIDAEASRASIAEASKVNKPETNPNGTQGQMLQSDGAGGTIWSDVGTPTDAQANSAISTWLTQHPEATTTVQDESITEAKLANELREDITNSSKSVGDLKSALNRNGLNNSNLIGSIGGVFYPVEIPTGTVLTMSTADRTAIGTAVNLKFHDINGNDISGGGWSFNPAYSKRTITVVNGGNTAYYVSWSSTPVKTVQLNFGSDVLPYEEYNYPIGYRIDQLKANTYEKHNLIGLDSTVYYPVDIAKDTVITMSTADGEVLGQSNLKLNFYDENKNYLTYWTFTSDLRYRTFTYNKETVAKYIKWNNTPIRTVQVEIGSKTNYVPYTVQIDNPDIIEKIYSKNDYLSASDIFNAEPYSGAYDWQTPVVTYGALFKGKSDVESFTFFTDPHVLGFGDTSRNEAKMTNYFKRLQKTFNATPCSFMVCGGDLLNNDTTMDEACYRLGYAKGIFTHLLDGCKIVLGNHDTNYQGKLDADSDRGTGRLTDATVASIMFRDTDTRKAYYSFDGANSKCYVLDTGIEHTSMLAYDWEQVAWLAGKLVGDDPSHAIIFLHIIINGENVQTNASNFGTLVEAYNNHTTVTLNGVAYDFTSCSGHVDFWVAGHTHVDSNGILGGIPYVVTATNSYNSDVPLIDLVLADYDNSLLYLKRVGGTGNDRIISLATGNLVT